MDYLSGLEDKSYFAQGTKLAEKLKDAEANIPEVGNGNPYLDGLVANPVNPLHDTEDTAFSVDKFLPKLYEIETRTGKIKDRPGSEFSGIAQLGKSERAPYLKKLGITDEQYKQDIELQKKAATMWITDLAARLKKNGFETNDINVWTAHNLGVGGLNQILHNKVSDSTLSNIRKQAGMNKTSTVSDYLEYYKDRLK